ncbi:MAG: ribosomal L7Ae/L30e/S12e/Gadd45 family protein [Candidatus Nanoarchaeia archaeon]
MDEIKKLLGSEKLIIGTQETMKAMRQGKLKKLFVVSNADPKFLKDLEQYKDMAKVEVEYLNMTNEELGAICRKPFLISVLGVLK